MKATNTKLEISSVIHGMAYTLITVNLFLMNFNVLIGRPVYIFVNISFSLIAMLLCLVVLFMRKGTDSTPLFGVFINVYSIIIVVGTLFFYKG